MKKLNILKTLLDLFYFFSLIAIVGVIIFGSMIYFGDEVFPIKVKGQEITVTDWAGKALIAFVMLSFFCFIYAIYLLREVIMYFVKREIFHDTVILYLNRIGICLIAAALLQNVPLFFYNMIQRNHLGIEFGIGGFDSLLLSIGLGLFFMVLSEVFKIAKNLKEENELTV